MAKMAKMSPVVAEVLTDELRIGVLQATATVAGAYISQNAVTLNEVPALLQTVHGMLTALLKETRDRQAPAVPISESVTDEFIICLEDGKPMKMLKRHLKSVYNMTLEEYRARWGLPDDYPTVAPSYTQARSSIAKKAGLGATPHRRRRLKIVKDETGEQAAVMASYTQ